MQTPTRLLARVTAPLARPLAGRRGFRLWGMLTYRGRRSGRTYRTPVAVGRTPDGFVIPIPFGDDTQWPKNVLAAGTARMRWAGREYELTAPEIVDKETAASVFGGFSGMALGSVPIEHFLRLREAAPA